MFDFHEPVLARAKKITRDFASPYFKITSDDKLVQHFTTSQDILKRAGVPVSTSTVQRTPTRILDREAMHKPVEFDVSELMQDNDVKLHLANRLGVKPAAISITRDMGDRFEIEVDHSDLISDADKAKFKNLKTGSLTLELARIPKIAKALKPLDKAGHVYKISAVKGKLGHVVTIHNLTTEKDVSFSSWLPAANKAIKLVLEREEERKQARAFLQQKRISHVFPS